MRIHVFGRTFMDLFIYGEQVHHAMIVETPGGSALNAACGLSLLGHNAVLHGTVGTDHHGSRIVQTVNQYGVNTQYLRQIAGSSNRFIARNDRAIAVQLGAGSDKEVVADMKDVQEDFCLIFATEISLEAIQALVNKPFKGLFIDLGPKYSQRLFPLPVYEGLILGNETEAQNNPCDVIKLGEKGAKWHEVDVPGNEKRLPYTIGAGDLFDVVVVDGVIKQKDPQNILREAVALSQKACLIPGSSTKIEILRDYHHYV